LLGLASTVAISVQLTKIDERIGVAWIQCGSPPQFGFSLLQIALLEQDISQQIVTAVVIGIPLKLRPKFGHSCRKARIPITSQVRQAEKVVDLRRSLVSGNCLFKLFDGALDEASIAIGAP